MLVVGAGTIYGSLAYFISIEIRSGKKRAKQDRKRVEEKGSSTIEEESYLPTEERRY